VKIPVALFLLAAAVPLAAAEPLPLDKRVGTLETQMKAVQRKVFPGGDARYFTPEIAPAAPVAAAPEGIPATSAVADLTARVDALERQQRTLTGQVEEAQNAVRQLTDAFAKYRGDTDFRLNAIEHPAAAAPADLPPPAAPPAKPGKAHADAAPHAEPAPPPVATLPVEDQWRAAYALYTAKDYARAEAAMTDFLAANPKAARASNAQYWLGRSYMAEDKFTQAAKAFLDGYKKYPDGDRAPESLLWLGNALTALKKTKQACQAYDELPASYAAKLTPSLKAQLAKAQKDAKCDA
jgi:tol-pal system protein YbgF